MTTWLPVAGKVVVVNVATPLALTFDCPMAVPSIEKMTTPVGTVVPRLDTVAVKV